MPRSWNSLYAEADRLDLSNRRQMAARAEFEAWAYGAEERALLELEGTVKARSRELLAQTGLSLVVEAAPADAREIAVRGRRAPVSIGLGTSRVDLYSIREPGASPCIHLGVQRGATSTRFPVFATIPGVLLIRSRNTDYEMLSLPLDDAVDPPRTNMDAFALRAFEVLLATHRSTLRSHPARHQSHAST